MGGGRWIRVVRHVSHDRLNTGSFFFGGPNNGCFDLVYVSRRRLSRTDDPCDMAISQR